MKPGSHAFISLGIAMLIYVWFNSRLAALLCFLSGVFLDLDHIPEYLTLPNRKLSLRHFYYSSLALEKDRIYLIFHSFELLVLFWGLISFWQLNVFWVAAATGISFHLVLDLLQNPIKSVYNYFLIFRFIKRFRTEELFRQGT